MELNPQLVIDELLKKVNALTVENIVLNSQVRQLTDQIDSYRSASPAQVMQDTIDSEPIEAEVE
jgi:hypothetical protein